MTKKRKFSEGLFNVDDVLTSLEINPGQTIVDAGCGNGYMAHRFAELVGVQGKVYALDCDAHLINILRSEVEGTRIEALAADICHRTIIESSSVDLVYLSTVFHIFSESQVAGFEREVKRILRPGGKLAILNIIKEDTPFGPPVSMRSSPEELRKKLSFTPKRLIAVGNFFYMQLFEKG